MKILGKRLIVEEIVEEQVKSSIIMVSVTKDPVLRGIVLGASNETPFEEGNIVLVSRFLCEPIKWNGKDVLITSQDHIIAVE